MLDGQEIVAKQPVDLSVYVYDLDGQPIRYTQAAVEFTWDGSILPVKWSSGRSDCFYPRASSTPRSVATCAMRERAALCSSTLLRRCNVLCGLQHGAQVLLRNAPWHAMLVARCSTLQHVAGSHKYYSEVPSERDTGDHEIVILLKAGWSEENRSIAPCEHSRKHARTHPPTHRWTLRRTITHSRNHAHIHTPTHTHARTPMHLNTHARSKDTRCSARMRTRSRSLAQTQRKRERERDVTHTCVTRTQSHTHAHARVHTQAHACAGELLRQRVTVQSDRIQLITAGAIAGCAILVPPIHVDKAKCRCSRSGRIKPSAGAGASAARLAAVAEPRPR